MREREGGQSTKKEEIEEAEGMSLFSLSRISVSGVIRCCVVGSSCTLFLESTEQSKFQVLGFGFND